MNTNPYALVRKNLNQSQQSVADACEVTKQVVTRMEQGCWQTPVRALTRGYAWLLHQHPSSIPDTLCTPSGESLAQAISRARLLGLYPMDEVDTLSQSLEAAYYQWIKTRRAKFAEGNKNKTYLRLGETGVKWKLLEDWKWIKQLLSQNGSVAGAAVAMCYQISLLQEFEKYGRGADGIQAALEEMGYVFTK